MNEQFNAFRSSAVARASYAVTKVLTSISLSTKRFIATSTLIAMITVCSERYSNTVRIVMVEMLKRLNEKPIGSTQFQVFDPSAPKNVIDLTKLRLELLVKMTKNKEHKKTLMTILDDYLNRKIAVGWSNSMKPVFKTNI
jgi:hypothetical protein